jgi:hypothetical protein
VLVDLDRRLDVNDAVGVVAVVVCEHDLGDVSAADRPTAARAPGSSCSDRGDGLHVRGDLFGEALGEHERREVRE